MVPPRRDLRRLGSMQARAMSDASPQDGWHYSLLRFANDFFSSLVLKGGQVEASPGWAPGDDAVARDRKRPPDGKAHSGRCCRKSEHGVTARRRPGDWRSFEKTSTVACRREHHDRP